MITFLSRRAGRAVAGPAGRTQTPVPRRPWWVWVLPFAVVLGVLLVRNAFIFSTPLYEDADIGADSILIEQARRFTLLVGNYSREKFNHPGPAFLYVQSWGESVFWAWLHVVPAAWNGQLIAMYALNALFAALLVAVGYGWTRSLRGGLAVFAVVLVFAAVHPAAFSTDWMPYLYVLAYLAFLVAIASVAGGRTADLWIAALAGWFCLHGHACFLFFVPVLTACAVIALAWPRRRRLAAALRRFAVRQRAAWVPAVVISVLFLVPIVAELVLHWPGNFGKYLGYGSSGQAGGHGLPQIIGYLLWFWWPRAHSLLAFWIACAAAGAAVWWCPRGRVRRCCASLLAFNAVSTLLAFVYAAIGIDELSERYIEYFYWTAPAVMLLIVVLAVTEALAGVLPRVLPAIVSTARSQRLVAVIAACGVLAAGTAFAVAAQTQTNTLWVEPAKPHHTQMATDPSLPAGVATLSALAGGRPVVLRFAHNAWPSITGILVQAERTGVPVCIPGTHWEFMMTSQFACTSGELARGRAFYLYAPPTRMPRWAHVVFRFNQATATTLARQIAD
ncbi:MAG TPA: hypothetical protein VGG75_10605 [Trebonia sp.]